AQTLPIRYRTENARAKQAIALRFEGAIVNGLGLGYFAMRPAPDFLRRGQADADGVEISDRVGHVKGARTIQGGPPLSRGRTPPLRGSRNQCRVSGFQFPVWSGSPSHLSGLTDGEQLPAGSLFQNCLVTPASALSL